MSAQHTPGPWVFERNRDISAPTPEGSPVVLSTITICEVLSGGAASLEQADANARLIAASPELLAALIRAEHKLAAYVGVCTGDKELTDAVLPMARAAIAKAGVQP